MRKVRVEAINGKKIYAGGHWLTCIGNKSVHVGEYIWTDGRCVYGFFKESQTPIVITAQQKEDWGIPIVMFNSDEKKFYYYTYKNSLKLVKTIKWDSSEKAFFDEGTQKKDYDFSVYPEYPNAFLVNNDRGRVYSCDDSDIITANCTPQGDIYYIKPAYDENKPTDPYELINETNFTGFDILKNGDAVKSADVSKLVSSALSEISSAIPHSPIYSTNVIANIYWAFIEDENNWACIFSLDGVAMCFAWDWDESFLYNHPRLEDGLTDGERANASFLYYVDSAGTQKLLYHWSVNRTAITYDYYGKAQWNYVGTTSSNNLTGLKIPLADGYYFTYGKDVSNSAILTVPSLCVRNIYTPKGELIFSGYFATSCHLTICQLRPNLFLMGVSNSGGDFYRVELSDSAWVDVPKYVYAGLYLCENGNLTPLFEPKHGTSAIGRPYEQAQYTCVNHCLRKMQKYQKWQDNVQSLNNVFLGSGEE